MKPLVQFMDSLKLYTFEDESGNILEQVRAFDREDALSKCTNPNVSREAEFYSESIDGLNIEVGKELKLKKQIQRGFNAINVGTILTVVERNPEQYVVLKQTKNLDNGELIHVREFEVQEYLESV